MADFLKAHPLPLFEPMWTPGRELVAPEITSAFEVVAVVAIGVSGGKDSAATALATIDYLEATVRGVSMRLEPDPLWKRLEKYPKWIRDYVHHVQTFAGAEEVTEIFFLRDQNKALVKLVAELKAENRRLRKRLGKLTSNEAARTAPRPARTPPESR